MTRSDFLLQGCALAFLHAVIFQRNSPSFNVAAFGCWFLRIGACWFKQMLSIIRWLVSSDSCAISCVRCSMSCVRVVGCVCRHVCWMCASMSCVRASTGVRMSPCVFACVLCLIPCVCLVQCHMCVCMCASMCVCMCAFFGVMCTCLGMWMSPCVCMCALFNAMCVLRLMPHVRLHVCVDWGARFPALRSCHPICICNGSERDSAKGRAIAIWTMLRCTTNDERLGGSAFRALQ